VSKEQQRLDHAKFVDDMDKLLKAAAMMTEQTHLDKETVNKNPQPNSKKTYEKTSEKNLKPIRILYIDDNPNDQVILKRSLEKYLEIRFTLMTASNMTEGLKKIEDEDFDLILLDYMLSGMTGIDVLEELRNRNIDINVILLTGQGNERIAVDAMKHGARDYCTKDKLDSKDLADTIRNLAIESVLSRLWSKEKAEKIVALFSKSAILQNSIFTAIDARSDHKVSVDTLISELEKFTQSQSIIECPNCGSSTTTSFLQCPECGNNQIDKENALEHIVCGCIDFEQKFNSGNSLTCPNCGRTLMKDGADYRKLESWFKCSEGHLFNNPILLFKCSNCKNQFSIETANLGKAYQYPISEA